MFSIYYLAFLFYSHSYRKTTAKRKHYFTSEKEKQNVIAILWTVKNKTYFPLKYQDCSPAYSSGIGRIRRRASPLHCPRRKGFFLDFEKSRRRERVGPEHFNAIC